MKFEKDLTDGTCSVQYTIDCLCEDIRLALNSTKSLGNLNRFSKKSFEDFLSSTYVRISFLTFINDIKQKYFLKSAQN